MKKILVAGAGGFIGGHLTRHLAEEGHEVTAVDIKNTDSWYQHTEGVKEVVADLKNFYACGHAAERQDRIYNLACNMGGMGFIQNNHVDCLESVLIQTNFVRVLRDLPNTKEIFYSSSACAYPQEIQGDVNSPALKESDAIPANPEDGYGWEKLFSEIITRYGIKDCGLKPRIFRFHNCYGPFGTWTGGREKAPAAMCRKVAEAEEGGTIEVWGDGQQTRSFLYIDECLEGVGKLMDSNETGPFNIGSDEMVTINQLAEIVIGVSEKNLSIKNIDGPLGVRGRCSSNDLIKEKLGWAPDYPLQKAIENTYPWVAEQAEARKNQ